MNLFQILALSVVGCLLILTVAAILRGWASRREGVFWTMLWLASAATLLWPDLTRMLARQLGIGRGADLLLYCTVVVGLVGFLMFYVRLRRLRRELTLLVRQLAIKDAVTSTSPPSPSASPTRGESNA